MAEILNKMYLFSIIGLKSIRLPLRERQGELPRTLLKFDQMERDYISLPRLAELQRASAEGFMPSLAYQMGVTICTVMSLFQVFVRGFQRC